MNLLVCGVVTVVGLDSESFVWVLEMWCVSGVGACTMAGGFMV